MSYDCIPIRHLETNGKQKLARGLSIGTTCNSDYIGNFKARYGFSGPVISTSYNVSEIHCESKKNKALQYCP